MLKGITWIQRIAGPLVLIAVIPTWTAAQDNGSTSEVAVWAQIAAGYATGGDNAAIMLGASSQIRSHVISVRSATTFNLFDDDFWDFALMYGLASRTSGSRITASAGVAIVDGHRCANFFDACEEISATIGLPLALDVAWIGLGFLGLGIHGFANINSEQSFGGIGLTVQLGKLR